MVQILPRRHPAATAPAAPAAATALRVSLRASWLARVGLLLTLGIVPATGCGGDDDSAADAGQDAGALGVCKPSDCPVAKPTMQICTVGMPTFTCARNIDLRCAWLLPRCTGTETGSDALPDATQDAGVASDVAGAEDAATDASDDASVD